MIFSVRFLCMLSWTLWVRFLLSFLPKNRRRSNRIQIPAHRPRSDPREIPGTGSQARRNLLRNHPRAFFNRFRHSNATVTPPRHLDLRRPLQLQCSAPLPASGFVHT